MKFLFILLIIPVFSVGQTVHIKDEKIMYEGKEKNVGDSPAEIFSRIQKLLPVIVDKYKEAEKSASSIKAEGELRLRTPYYIVRKVSYFITVSATENGYEYVIDSVSFRERERGKTVITKTSGEVIEGISETGKVVGETEKILNETDMQFQKLLALLRAGTSKQ